MVSALAAPPLPGFPVTTGGAPQAIPPIGAQNSPQPQSAGAPDAAPADEELEDPINIATRIAPPWLFSCVLHMILLIVLGVWLAANLKKPEIELEVSMVYADTLGEQLLDDTVSLTTPIPEPALKRSEVAISDLPEVADPFAAPPVAEFNPGAITRGVPEGSKALAIGNPLSGRQAGRKRELLAKYGGNEITEAAVTNALGWLKRNQREDGSWSLIGPYKDGGSTENTIAATAMALLAFQGAGHNHLEGQHKTVVERGWTYLLKQQSGEGAFSAEAAGGQFIYSHAQATIALCELYGMTNDDRFREPAIRAVQYCVKIQAREGGWKYSPGQGSDMSVTGWVVMALQSAKMAGLEVPSQTLDNVSKFIDSVALQDGTRYVYQPGETIRDPAITAEALLCRQYLGWKRDNPRLKRGVEYLLANPMTKDTQNVYYWYYGTQVVHHMEGDAWEKWNDVMRQYLPETQVKSGAEAGSWNPLTDAWGNQGGRLYVTCMSAFMLEVYYRHLPIYTKVFDEAPAE
jgi:prenyltransferase beta subunit